MAYLQESFDTLAMSRVLVGAGIAVAIGLPLGWVLGMFRSPPR